MTTKGSTVQFTCRGKLMSGIVKRIKKDGTITVEVRGDDAFLAVGDEVGWVDVNPCYVVKP